jgi:hypothetical protein
MTLRPSRAHQEDLPPIRRFELARPASLGVDDGDTRLRSFTFSTGRTLSAPLGTFVRWPPDKEPKDCTVQDLEP